MQCRITFYQPGYNNPGYQCINIGSKFMATDPLNIRVEGYPDDRGEETPRRFFMGDQSIQIEEVIDRWLAPDYAYFKVRASENDIYILRHDLLTQRWELTLFQSGKHDASQLPSTWPDKTQKALF